MKEPKIELTPRVCEPPGVLCVEYRFDRHSLVFEPKERAYADILVEELEARMRFEHPSPRKYAWGKYTWGEIDVDAFKAAFFGTPAQELQPVHDMVRKYYANLGRTAVCPLHTKSPRTNTKIIIDDPLRLEVDYEDIEYRLLTQVDGNELAKTFPELISYNGKTCRTPLEPPPPPIFQPSPFKYDSSGKRDSAIPKLLGDLASRNPPSTAE